ncbi:hypothetical protein [Siminovitchia sp. 179-K 8D1 HS]|uniref:hypothetical protein n=1 Tax=Siminovitchia sp. 179-K 8D1 HS TaxID=3142385 RepID=UPI0039A152BD
MGKAKNINSLILLSLGLAGAYLSSRENREKAMEMVSRMKDKAMSLWGSRKDGVDLIEKAGHPDKYSLEDAKMVSEGSQYGVHYYNEEQQQP